MKKQIYPSIHQQTFYPALILAQQTTASRADWLKYRLIRALRQIHGVPLRLQGSWATPRQAAPKIPKVREHAQLSMTDGTILTGYVFVEATSRIQDVLNGETQFIPFIDENEEILLLNKTSIMQVRPFDT